MNVKVQMLPNSNKFCSTNNSVNKDKKIQNLEAENKLLKIEIERLNK